MMRHACHVLLVAVYLVFLATKTTCITVGAEDEAVVGISVSATTISDRRRRRKRILQQNISQVPQFNMTTRSMDYGYTIYNQDKLIRPADAILKFRQEARNATQQLVVGNPKIRIVSLNETVVGTLSSTHLLSQFLISRQPSIHRLKLKANSFLW
jgi:hypothetical protein